MNIRPMAVPSRFALAALLALLCVAQAPAEESPDGSTDTPSADAIPATGPAIAVALDEAPTRPPAEAFVADLEADRTDQLLESADFDAILTELAGLGVDTLIYRPQGTWTVGSVTGNGFSQTSLERTAALVAAAGRHSLSIIMGPIQVSPDTGEASADPEVAGAAVAQVLGLLERALADQPAFAGVCIGLPALPSAVPSPPSGEGEDQPQGASRAEVDRLLGSWSAASRQLVAAAASTWDGTSFVHESMSRKLYVAADSPAELALALADAPASAIPLYRIGLDREPTLRYPLLLGSLDPQREGQGVWLHSYASDAAQTCRAMALATLRGADLICLGDLRLVLGDKGRQEYLAHTVASLVRFVQETDYSPADQGIGVLFDAEAELRRQLGADMGGIGEWPSAMAVAMLLNLGGYPWSVITDTRQVENRRPRVLVAAGGNLSDEGLDCVEAYVRAGGKLVAFGDFGALRPSGGARLGDGRSVVDLLLPVSRTRRTRPVVSTIRLTQAIPGAPHASGAEVRVGGAAQSLHRVEPHSGAVTLAEYADLHLAAMLAHTVDSGAVVWLNCSPAMLVDNLLADALAYVGEPPIVSPRGGDLRRPASMDDMHSGQRSRLLEYRTALLNPEGCESPMLTGDGGAYDLYLAGEGLAALSLGYRRETRPEGSMVGLGSVDAGLKSFKTVIVSHDGQFVWTDTTGHVEWPVTGALQSYCSASDSFETWIYEPGGQKLRAARPGLYRPVKDLAHHALIDDGGARVLRAVQRDDGTCEVQVDRHALVRVRLDVSILATRSAQVLEQTPAGLLPVVEGRDWHVDCDSVLHLEAAGDTIYEIEFSDRPEEREAIELALDNIEAVRLGLVDGTRAIWLDRYRDDSATARFVHWTRAEKGADLVLTGVTGNMYGDGKPEGTIPPARLRVEVNGSSIAELDSTAPPCVLDGKAEEWGDLSIPLPASALRRGLNEIRIINDGPNWFAFRSAAVRFRADERRPFAGEGA